MSRVGVKPIAVPGGVTVQISGRQVNINGPKGKSSWTFPANAKVAFSDSTKQISVERLDNSKQARANHGLTRALLANMVKGVTQGYERTLEINGVGYKAEQKGTKLVLTLGYSHPCEIELPAGVTAKIDKQTVITIKGADKQVVGQMAAQLRAFKKPEPYQGKGVKYAEEVIRRKVGKTGAK